MHVKILLYIRVHAKFVLVSLFLCALLRHTLSRACLLCKRVNVSVRRLGDLWFLRRTETRSHSCERTCKDGHTESLLRRLRHLTLTSFRVCDSFSLRFFWGALPPPRQCIHY